MGHIADKGVTLTKRRWKKREVRGGEEKLLENCGKKVKKREGKREKGEKRKHWRKKEKREVKWRRKVERREQERREGWEAQRAEGLLHDVANVVGILPAMSHPLLQEKRPCSNLFGKTQKCGKNKKNANLSRANTGS